MPMTSYLMLTGETQGPIEGSCDQAGREGTILVQAFDHEVRIPNDRQTGQPTGQRVHKSVNITKVFDKSSPKIFQALCSGELFSEVTFHFYRINKQGAEEHYYTIKLEEAIIVSQKKWIPNCLDPNMESFTHMEDLSFTYTKMIQTEEIEGIETEDSWKTPRS